MPSAISRYAAVALLLPLSAFAAQNAHSPRASVLVTLDESAIATPVSGRLLVLMTSDQKPVDVITPAAFGREAQQQWIAAQGVTHWSPGETIQVDVDETAWPRPLASAPNGDYQLMAILDVDHNAGYTPLSAGDLRSGVIRAKSLLGIAGVRLTQRVPAPAVTMPPGQVQIELLSPSLSAFWGRPVKMRAIVILPPGYNASSDTTYPTLFFTSGYGASMATLANGRVRRIAEGMRAGDLPPMLWIVLDHQLAGGTHEFVNSVNNGPWGHALTTELLPYLEREYRMDPPSGRFLNGHSSGGWAALWLQVQNPDLFGGTWATSPDPVDFSSFVNVDLYTDSNMYVEANGEPTPMIREQGRITQTLASNAKQEAVVGAYGGQWSSFEWVFSPRAPDGRPALLFNRTTGQIDAEVAAHWRQHFDISRILRDRAPELVPKLKGKIHVAVGTADQFHLDRPVRLLEQRIQPLGYAAKFTYLKDWDHFALVQDGLEVDRFGRGVMTRIAMQMYQRARPNSGWTPKNAPHPASELAR